MTWFLQTGKLIQIDFQMCECGILKNEKKDATVPNVFFDSPYRIGTSKNKLPNIKTKHFYPPLYPKQFSLCF